MRAVRQIKGGSGAIKRGDRARGRAPRAALGQSTVGNPAPLSESKHSRCPASPPVREPTLAANCCGVDRSGLDPERPHGVALWKVGACVSILVKNVDIQSAGADDWRPSAATSRARTQDAGSGRALTQSPSSSRERRPGEPAGRWPSAHIRRSDVSDRCDPAITVKIEANRGRYGRQRFAAIGVDDWLASAIACVDRHWRHSCAGA